MVLQRVCQDAGVGPPCQRDLGKRVGNAEQRLERAGHAALAGAAGEHERSVDIEQHQLLSHRSTAELGTRATPIYNSLLMMTGRLHMRQVTGLALAVFAAAGISLPAQSPTTPGHEAMSMTPSPRPPPTSPARASPARRRSRK